MDNINYLFDSVKTSLKESSSSLYAKFYKAFELLAKDSKQAEIKLLEIIKEADYLINSFSYYDETFDSLNIDELFLYYGQILSLVTKSSHNLYVIKRNNKDDKGVSYWLDKKLYYSALLYHYYHLSYIYKTEDKIKEILKAFYLDVAPSKEVEAYGDLMLFNFILRVGLTDEYFAHIKTLEHRHWYNSYLILSSKDNDNIRTCIDNAYTYISLFKDDVNVKRLLYHCIFYQSLALDNAYSKGKFELAHYIYQNGYDYYLEIETLYLIDKYEPNLLEIEVNKLKKICLERLHRNLLSNPILIYQDIYPEKFLSRLSEMVEASLTKIDSNDKHRFDENRHTPDWAK